jgi:phosphate transport system substrate-binding protein
MDGHLTTRRTVAARMTALAACLFVAAAFSCQKKGQSTGATPPAKSAKGTLTIKGSDTMVQLTSAWAEAFMKVRPEVEIAVTGGGSGTGFAALLNGTTNLCAASREISEKEKKQAEEKGLKPIEVTVARDGIAVVVHPQNPVSVLTLEQLKKIYTGAYTKWSQVGGPDEAIILLSRESNSGTYMFFQEHVLEKADYAQATRLMPATSAIVQAVSTDKTAIGYVGLGYAVEAKGKVKVIAVKAKEDTPAVTPSEEAVKAGTYAIARKLYFYANGTPGGAAKDFVEFCLSEAGQKIVRETGYVTVK